MTSLVRTATSQHGLLTTEQLRAAGVTRSAQTRMATSGLLEPARRGVLRLAGAPVTWHQSVLAAILSPGAPAVASHRSALRLWDLRTRFDGIDLCVRRPATRSLPGVVVRRSVDLEAADIVMVDGIPTTTPERTLCDAGVIFPAHEVLRLVEHATAIGLVGSADLLAIRRRVGEHGRTGVGGLQQALDCLVPGPHRGESGPEVALLRLLGQAGLPRPVPQLEVEANGRRYRLDLGFPEHRLAVEYDGVDVHTRVDRFVSDRRRQNDLVAAGWAVVRVTGADLRERPEALVTQIRSLLHSDLG